jgi:hypothetical protein
VLGLGTFHKKILIIHTKYGKVEAKVGKGIEKIETFPRSHISSQLVVESELNT